MGIWKDKTRGDWIYKFEFQGKSYGSRGFLKKSDARSAREDRRKELKAAPDPIQIAMVFSVVANDYLDDAVRRFAKKTYDYKKYVYRSFVAFAGDLPVDQITPQLIHKYLSTRSTNSNYNSHRKDLSALFHFAIKRLKLLTHNPVVEIPPMPHQTPQKHIPTEEQVLSLIMASEVTTERPLILCLVHTLARVDELLRWTWQDINFEHRTVTLWTRKRSGGQLESDSLPMNDDLFDVLQGLWKRRKQDTWVFFNEKTKSKFNRRPKMMPSICKRAKIDPPFGFHAIRHFMATRLADSGKVSKKTISGILRHKSLSTTEIYLHSIDKSHKDAMDSVTGIFGGGFGGGFDENSRHQEINMRKNVQ
jgi:integrase